MTIINPNDWVLFRLPSDNVKLLEVRPNTYAPDVLRVRLTGKKDSHQLVGLPYDVAYEVEGKKLKRATNTSMVDLLDIEHDEFVNNQHLHDNGSSQQLSQQQIEELKKSATDSRQVIESIVSNSVTFASKTGHAKMKYIRRKEKKYSRVFTPVKPTISSLAEFYFSTNRAKISSIRVDTLGQLLCHADVRAGGNYLVIDDTHGLVLAAMMERMGGVGNIVAIHEHPNAPYDLVKFMNFSADVTDVLRTVSWKTFLGKEDPAPLDPSTHSQERVQKRAKVISNLRIIRDLFATCSFDGLIVSGCTFPPSEIIPKLRPFLAGSRPIVVYSPAVEPLTPLYTFMRSSSEYVKVELTEGWMREYQLPVHASGTHPFMTYSAGGGYLLSALSVFRDDEEDEVVVRNNEDNGVEGDEDGEKDVSITPEVDSDTTPSEIISEDVNTEPTNKRVRDTNEAMEQDEKRVKML